MQYKEYRGIRGLVCAEVTKDDGTYETSEWRELSGVQSVSLAKNESSETHYYDNQAAIVIDAEGADEVTLVVSVLDNETRALIDGVAYEATKKMLVNTPKKRKYFALGYIGEKTDGTEEFNILYKGKFSGGAETHNTKDDGTEATNIEYTFTAIHTASKIYTDADDGNKKKPAKSVKLAIDDTATITEEKLFGTFTAGKSTVKALTPDDIAKLA